MNPEPVFDEDDEGNSPEATRPAPRKVARTEGKERTGWSDERRARFQATLAKKARAAKRAAAQPSNGNGTGAAMSATEVELRAAARELPAGFDAAMGHLAHVRKLLADKPISSLTDAEVLTLLALRTLKKAA